MEESGGPAKDLPQHELLFLNSLECPFAQRTWIALMEKGLPFNRMEINLRNAEGMPLIPYMQHMCFYVRVVLLYPVTHGVLLQVNMPPSLNPRWFLELNPNAKVPVLVYKEGQDMHRVWESNICNEFLEELMPQPALMPTHPAARARARMIIQQFSDRFVPNFYKLLLRQDSEGQQQASDALHEQLRWLESSFDSKRPFFLGEQFSLLDISLLPFFLRFPVLQHYRQFSLPQECPKLAAWWQTAKNRPSVQIASESGKAGLSYDEYLVWVYERYADASAKSTSAADFKDK